jgi:outer membrane receptor for ferrienterochelin and colicins
VTCGFGLTRVLALGNADLEVEKTRTWEVGYKGILGGRAFLTVDYYRSAASNFVTDLLPQLGTALGRVNPNFGPWQGPQGLPESAAAMIRSLAPPTLSNNFDGTPIIAAVSYTNFGEVNTQGVDIGLNYYLPAAWRASVSYSWFDFELGNQLPGFDTLLLPNSPEHSVTLGVLYDRDKLDAGVDIRAVDEFRWGVGPFQGDVESYVSVDSNHITIGLQIANLFDDKHWEAFGGDVLRRRALTNLKYRW